MMIFMMRLLIAFDCLLIAVIVCSAFASDGSESVCCDICTQLNDPNSRFYQLCGSLLQPLLLQKTTEACSQHQADPEQLSAFMTNLRETCYIKASVVVKLDCDLKYPEEPVECNECDGVPNMTCVKSLNPLLKSKIHNSCISAKNQDAENFVAFWQNLEEICVDKDLQYEKPTCAASQPCQEGAETCDVCDGLKEMPCFNDLHQLLQSKIHASCLSANLIGEEEFEAFWQNLEEICVDKELEFEKPQCLVSEPCDDNTCNECDSVTGMSCVQNLNELLQSKIHTSCLSAKEAGSDEYDAFWENLEEICGDKNFVFEKPQCPLDQPDEDEVETCSECDGVPEMSCVKNLNELLQSKIHTSCLSAKEAGSDEFDAFWENLEEICGDKNFAFEKPQCPLDQPDEDEDEACSECDGVPEMSCVQNLNELLQSKIHTSCLSSQEAGDDELAAFWQNLEEICGDKNFVFEKPQCPLDQPDEGEDEACSECDGVPEMSCVQNLNELLQSKIHTSCLSAQEAGSDELAAFWENLEEICGDKNLGFEKPQCPLDEYEACSECDGVPEMSCVKNLNQLLQDKIHTSCLSAKDAGADELSAFWQNLEEVCVDKGLEYEQPQCPGSEPCQEEACDECEGVTDMVCVQELNALLQARISASCVSAREQGAEDGAAFWQNLEEICVDKNLNFEKPQCPASNKAPETTCVGVCDLCGELTSPDSEFTKICSDQLKSQPTEFQQLVTRCQTFETSGDWSELDTLMASVVTLCLELTGSFVEMCKFKPAVTITHCPLTPAVDVSIPTSSPDEEVIADCSTKPIDIVFAIDDSSVQGDVNFNKGQSVRDRLNADCLSHLSLFNVTPSQVKGFVRSVIEWFDTDSGLVRVGLVEYDLYDSSHVTFSKTNHEATILQAVQRLELRNLTDSNCHLAIKAASAMFEDKRQEASQVLVILPAQPSSERQWTYHAMKNLRHKHPSVVTIAFGIKGNLDLSETRALATGLGNSNVILANGFDDLENDVDVLIETICEAKPNLDEEGCAEVLYESNPHTASFEPFHGVYERSVTTKCQGVQAYIHTSGVGAMWRDASEMYGLYPQPVWKITPIACNPHHVWSSMMADKGDYDPLTDEHEEWMDGLGEKAITTCYSHNVA